MLTYFIIMYSMGGGVSSIEYIKSPVLSAFSRVSVFFDLSSCTVDFLT